MLVYGTPHGTPHSPPVAEAHAPLTLAEGSPPGVDQLTAALRSASALLPAPLDALTLIIPAAHCRMAQRSFPAALTEAEAHALAAQMATQIAAEHGHSAPVAFDWRCPTATEIALCLAPRALIAGYLSAVHGAGMRCIAITPENEADPGHPTSSAAVPFNLIPWRNTVWLQRGRARVLWLAATTLFIITAAALIAYDQNHREQALNTQHARLQETLKTRQDQLSDLAQRRQQLEAQRAVQHAEHSAREAAQRQQQALATQLDQLARRRPQGIRYHSLSYDNQGLRLEGLAQTPEALTRLLKALPCPSLSEGHREARREGHGSLRFALQIPGACRTTP